MLRFRLLAAIPQALSRLFQAIGGPHQWLLKRVILQLAQRAKNSVDQGQLQLALALYQRILTLDPDNAAILQALANVLVKQEQWTEAIEICQRALHVTPDIPWIHHTLAQAYLGQGSYLDSVAASQQAIAQDPDVCWFQHDLAKALQALERWDEALEAAQRAVELEPDVSWLQYTLGQLLLQHSRWTEAIQACQQSLNLNPAFPWVYYSLGEALIGANQLDDALKVYQEAKHLFPSISIFQECQDYIEHLQTQWHRIQSYCHQTLTAADPFTGTDTSPDINIGHRTNTDTNTSPHKRLRILMLMPYPPYPPQRGAYARMFYDLKCLGAKHEVVLAAFIFTYADVKLVEALQPYCELPILVMIGDKQPPAPGWPQLVHSYSSQRLRRILETLSPLPFDVVSCHFIYMAQYMELFPHCFTVLEEHNIESNLLQRCADISPTQRALTQLGQDVGAVKAFWEAQSEANLMRAYEDTLWPQFCLRTVVSPLDAQEMAQRSPGSTLVVSNGIDTQAILPFNPPDSSRILFIGTLSYYPNIDGSCYFVESILPYLWDQDPDITVCIAGADPPPKVLALAQDPRIEVIANPDDMQAIARTSRLTIVPLRIGSGTRIKILHSMAMGLPVVSTSLGCEGLEVTDRIHLLIRDDPQEFAMAVREVLKDPILWQQLRQAGRRLVEQRYDWHTIFSQFEQELRQAVLQAQQDPSCRTLSDGLLNSDE